MPILHSLEENKLEYEDEDEVKIKMIGTELDKESLEHNLYENDITPIICHNFSPTSNPPIKPKDSGSFRMKVIFDEEKPRSRKAYLLEDKQILSVGVFDEVSFVHTEHGNGVTGFKRRRQNFYSNGIKDLTMASECSRPKETREDSAS
ncbi:hypothetical protein Tco_0488574 [Tanacetum coccineum]